LLKDVDKWAIDFSTAKTVSFLMELVHDVKSALQVFLGVLDRLGLGNGVETRAESHDLKFAALRK